MVISLGWLSPATSRGLPAAQTTRAGSRCLLGLAPTGGYRATPVARRAVGSYPTFSPLPLEKGRSVLCGPFRRLAAPRRYLAVCPLELGLSSGAPLLPAPRDHQAPPSPEPNLPTRAGPGQACQRARRRSSRARLSGRRFPPRVRPAGAAAAPASSQNPSLQSNSRGRARSQSGTRGSGVGSLTR